MGNKPIGVSSSTVLPDTACRSASPVSLEGSASAMAAKPNWITTRRSNRGNMEKTPLSDQGVRREPNCEVAPQQSLLCRLALLHIVDFLGGLVLQLNRFVQGLVTQIARIIFDLVEGRFFGGLELRRLH